MECVMEQNNTEGLVSGSEGLDVKAQEINFNFKKQIFYKKDYLHENFSNNKFFSCNFENCVFSSCDFRFCIFEDCEFYNARFLKCDFGNAVIQDCHINNTSFLGSDGFKLLGKNQFKNVVMPTYNGNHKFISCLVC
jgi:uncharacterized protein YjbI with pentapeptide repeats